jgi:hypothetical protein
LHTFLSNQPDPPEKLIIALKSNKNSHDPITLPPFAVDIRYEEHLINNLVDFTYYKQQIAKEFCQNEVAKGCGFSLDPIYTPLEATLYGDSIGDLEEYVVDWLNEREIIRHLAILGESGEGKSVFTLKLTHEMLQHPEKYNRIPILITLRGQSPRNLSIKDLLSIWAGRYRIIADSIYKLHQAGKLLIILEGFDEIDLVGDRKLRMAHFKNLWQLAHDDAKIIITGRPNFFFDTGELERALGTISNLPDHPYCDPIKLSRLNSLQVEHALRKAVPQTRQDIMSLLSSDQVAESFKSMISRPSTLFQASIIWKEEGFSAIKDQVNSAVITGAFLKYNYSRQGPKAS